MIIVRISTVFALYHLLRKDNQMANNKRGAEVIHNHRAIVVRSFKNKTFSSESNKIAGFYTDELNAK